MPLAPGAAPHPSSVDADEVEKFSRIAAQWWDPRGKFAPLHKFNPVRLGFIRDQAAARLGRDARAPLPFEGLRLLDIGCGGGLLAEPMARLGFAVTGVDASAKNVGVASAHAGQSGLQIDYRNMTVEELLVEDAGGYDVVLNMEVVEHVTDPGRFLRDASRLVKPGGLMVVATLNRTLKALATAKIGAEYILGWLPRGAHDWRKFLTPDEVRLFLSSEPVAVQGPFGVAYSPLADRWSLSQDTSVNYMMTVERA
ncbi:bifunctional 2-polyprenyl-6-hydroxyphenol methylase/3-demethylubiquinol 3-O-methyltransferase UbiG [Caulobacter sp. S45]|uniref:bifunctional 2-polyprenyl-6-hydroxyphenol methylase/3-demethylubiquinol 3-O-methyltransferase UbiG n=1 Tax=Caulobacter sp. S45 TaxID=1641861 RepID=UPI00157662A6|nr:bifunctional 2-polyprenyl-6-hydroxyphenol methylase/3-demethylubiquinol 3-O-methyltransferase UbiG [Caulobacter sp. S45]